MNMDSTNYKNIMRTEISANSSTNTTKVYFKFFEKSLDKSSKTTTNSYGFNIINEGSENSDYVTNLNLFLRVSYGTTKNLKVNCEVLSEFSNKGKYSTPSVIRTIITETDEKYIIQGFIEVYETYIRYKVYPYINTDSDNIFVLKKYYYSTDEYNSFSSSATKVINWEDNKHVIYGDTRIKGNLMFSGMDSNLHLNDYNFYSKKFTIGGNGITPRIDNIDYPVNNLEYIINTGYRIGGNVIPRDNKLYNLGNTSNMWNELYCNVLKSNFINVNSPNGTTYQIKVNDNGELYTYKP